MKDIRIIKNKQAQGLVAADKVNTTGIIDFTLTDNKGQERRLSSLQGKVVMLDFHLFAGEKSLQRIMMLRELYNKYHAAGLELYHYRDTNGLECDTVLHRRNGTYALLEVKLGGEEHIEEGASNMKTLADNIDTNRMLPPAFMAVIVGIGKYAYQRKDGVFVISIWVCFL